MKKLRRFYTPAKLKEIYAHTYDPSPWPEHLVRIQRTIGVAQRVVDEYGMQTVSDLSCGNRAIVKGLTGVTLQDVRDGNIERDIVDTPNVDLFIFTETAEHLEAPWTVLEQIAEKTKWLVLSTPLDEDPVIGNYEHYWSFTEMDVHSMLLQSGFADLDVGHLGEEGWTYTYQLWTARSIYA